MFKQQSLCIIIIIFLCLVDSKSQTKNNELTQNDYKANFNDLEIQTNHDKIIININLVKSIQKSTVNQINKKQQKVFQVNINLDKKITLQNQQVCQNQKQRQVDLQRFCPKKQWPTNQNIDTKKRFIKVNTRYGNQMYIDSFDQYKSQELKKNGVTYPGNIYLIGKWIKKGAKVLNLGAHNGMQAIIVGKEIGQCGHLYIFQPYSVSYRILRKNLQINGILDRSTTYNLAAYNKQSQSELHISYKNTGGNSVINLGWTDDIFKQKIKLVKVDDVLPQNVQLDFALVDVQRVQANALMGMKKIIQRSPKLVMIVQWQKQFDIPLAKEILIFLLGRGYQMYNYEGKNDPCVFGSFIEIKTIDELLKMNFIDVIFVPKNVQLPK